MTCLLLTRSPDLHAEVSRLAAAAGIEPSVLGDPAAALAGWSGAEVVLVGDDMGADLVGVHPARRSDVHVVGLQRHDHMFRTAVALGAESVIDLADGGTWLAHLLADVGEPREVAHVVGVVGGAGGVGATTLACALAQAGAESGEALLVDLDPVGPGVDRLFGLDEAPGVRWADLHATSGRLGARALRESVPRRDGLGVLTWSGPSRQLDVDAVRQALAAARRGHDLVVVDLPRHGGVLAGELVHRCDDVVVVCPATLTGVAATARVVEGLGLRAAAAGLALRPGRVAPGDVEAALGLSVWFEVPHERGVSDALDLGVGPAGGRRSRLARVARQALARPVGAGR
jgi:secretion/DNA translocation related CpaE-like protein